MNNHIIRVALLASLLVGSWLAGCGAAIRPAELIKADGLLQNRDVAAQATRSATEVYKESRAHYKKAVEAYVDGDLEKSAQFATLATLRFETAREMTLRMEAEDRQTQAETRRVAAEKMQKNDKARLADLNKRIIRMEKIIALQADASRFKKAKEEELKRREAEKKAAEEKLAAERKAAEENLAKMKIQQTAQAALAKAASKIQAAEALDANKHDSKNLDAAKIGLQKARYDFEQGKFQDVPASAEVAYKKAEEAIATAQAKFAEENKKIALLKERESLFKEATIIQGVNARQEARGVVFTLYDMFPSNKTTVVPEQAYLLDKIAKLTKKYPGYPILVEAYTDSRGREVDNLALSQGRAQSVLAYFVEQHKLGFNRIRSSGYGEANPVADNSNSAGRAKNRRVEMIFLFR